MEQKTEPERLKIGQEVICLDHGAQTIDMIDDFASQQITFYVLTCGCTHPVETEEVNKLPTISRRKGPYNNWG